MNLRDLRYFVTVAESGCILAASEKLHVAQPSLSVRIKTLETELGVALFDRRPRGVMLTAEGQELLVHARHILQSAEAAQEALRHHAQSPVGTVRFGVPTSLSSVLCVPLIEAVTAQLPNVRLRLVETMSGTIIDWLRSGELDIGLIFLESAIAGIHSEPLLAEGLHLAASSEAALAPLRDARGDVPIDALAGQPLILPSEHHGLRQLIDQHLRRSGVSARVVIEIDAFLQIQRLVQRGRGMTILSLAALYESDFDPPLATARIVGPTIERTVYLARADIRPQTKAAREVGRLAAGLLVEAAGQKWWQARPSRRRKPGL
jgi:LysR family transcriptional regulator, nitrogen assimilation regulatory protein